MRQLLATVSMAAMLAAAPAIAQTSTNNQGSNTVAPAAQSNTPQATPNMSQAAQPNAAKTTPPSAANQNTAAQGNPQDANSAASFAQTAGASNMTEVQAGQLAKDHAQSSAVKVFAAWMVTDHTMAQNMLQDAAKTANAQVGTAPTSEQQAMIQKLQGLKGAQFDQAYLDDMIKAHKETLDALKAEAGNGQAGPLQNWASTMLPAVEAHLDAAQMLQGTMHSGGTTAAQGATNRQEHANIPGHREVQRLNQQELDKVRARDHKAEHATAAGNREVERLNQQELDKVKARQQ